MTTLLRGTQFRALTGVASVVPEFDFETYSEAGFVWNERTNKWDAPEGTPKGAKKGLFVVGAVNYVQHETFEILCLYYDLKDGVGLRAWRPGLPLPQDLFDYLATGGPVEAHNSSFERWVWTEHCVPKLGWPAIQFYQWRCSAAKSRASSYPGGLDNAGTVLQLPIQKDKDGTRLLNKFSIPRNPTKTDPRKRLRPEEDPVDGPKLYNYCAFDVMAEGELSIRLPDLVGFDLEYWQCDQAINFRGVHIDRESLEHCAAIVRQALTKYNAELFALTGIDSASKLEQLKGWLLARGVSMDSLDEEHVDNALELVKTGNWVMPRECFRVLELRSLIGSASVKKVFNLANRITRNDRVHDLFIFQGARTGRPTGEGPQPTNMPKAGPDLTLCGHLDRGEFVEGSGCGHYMRPGHLSCPWCRMPVPPDRKPMEWNPSCVSDGLFLIKARSLELIEYYLGDAMHVVAGCLRGLFDAAPGCDLISSDYSAIEAVVLAMLANETWRIEVFRTHGAIYEASASMMYDVPLEEFKSHKKATGQHHPLRGKGKIGELAFGYQGWLGAAKQFGMPGTDEEIKQDILRWRKASPGIEWLWGGQTQGQANGIRSNAGYSVPLNWRGDGPDRWDKTPYYFGVEGAAICAVLNPGVEQPVIRLDGQATGIVFFCIDDVLYLRLLSGRLIKYHRPRLEEGERAGWALSYEGWNTNEKNGPKGWIRMNTWGGRFVENIVQAVSNDILRFASVNLERYGYPIVLHVYDEIVSEVSKGVGSILQFEAIMATMPPWAQGWPIKAAGGWRDRRYRKG